MVNFNPHDMGGNFLVTLFKNNFILNQLTATRSTAPVPAGPSNSVGRQNDCSNTVALLKMDAPYPGVSSVIYYNVLFIFH